MLIAAIYTILLALQAQVIDDTHLLFSPHFLVLVTIESISCIKAGEECADSGLFYLARRIITCHFSPFMVILVAVLRHCKII